MGTQFTIIWTVRVVKKRSTPARHDLVHASPIRMVGIVVIVPGQEELHPAAEEQLKLPNGAVSILIRVDGLFDPVWFSVAQDDLIVWAYALLDLLEKRVLWPVDVTSKLKVGADEPPAFWELQNEVAALLLRFPASKAPP